MIKRRYFLLGGAAAVLAAIGIRLGLSSEQDSITAILYKRLNYLKLDSDGVHAFAQDLAARHNISSARLKSVSAMGPLYGHLDSARRNFFMDGIRHGEERVVTNFLL